MCNTSTVDRYSTVTTQDSRSHHICDSINNTIHLNRVVARPTEVVANYPSQTEESERMESLVLRPRSTDVRELLNCNYLVNGTIPLPSGEGNCAEYGSSFDSNWTCCLGQCDCLTSNTFQFFVFP